MLWERKHGLAILAQAGEIDMCAFVIAYPSLVGDEPRALPRWVLIEPTGLVDHATLLRPP